MRWKNGVIAVVAVLTLVPLTRADAQSAGPSPRSCSSVLEHEVCTWVLMDGSTVRELGVTVPLGLVEAVPADAEMAWPPEELATVDLPEEARAVLGIDHLAINWEVHGHPPGPFLTPHFDFHFYSLTRDEVRAVDCTDGSKPSSLPAGYALPDIDVPGLGTLLGLCVPGMGMHAMPDDEIEATAPFSATLMMGYYGGKPIFFEPMVSRDRLLRRSDFTLPVPRTAGLPEGVRYPSELRAEYDAALDRYRLIMTGFGDR